KRMPKGGLPPEEDPVKLRKRISAQEREIRVLTELVGLLKDLPANKALAKAGADDPLAATPKKKLLRPPPGRPGARERVPADAGTGRYEGGSVGGPTQAADVIGLLTRLEAEGRLPLALGTDNGVYRSEGVQAHLAARQVVWFPSRPHTPQDNGAMERGIREMQ